MGKIENTWLETWKTKVSVFDKIKKIWIKIGDMLYNVFFLWWGYVYRENWKYWIYWLTPAKYDEFMLCGTNYIWAQTGDKWKLLDKNWHEIENFEVDDVREWCLDLTVWYWTYEWRVFRKGQKWWMVANDWTIVLANYDDVSIHEFDNNGDFRTYAVWKEILENWEEKLWEISIEDWSRTEYNPSKIEGEDSSSEDNSEESESNEEITENLSFREKLKKVTKETSKNLRDDLYNKFLKDKFVLDIDWQKEEFKSYMLNWKVWIEWVLEPEYEELEPCSEKFIWMRDWKKRWLIDFNWNVVIEPKFNYVDKNTYEVGGKQWFINLEGEDLWAKYDFILWNYVVVGKKMWLVDRKNGKEIISPIYDDLHILSWCLIAKVRLWDKYWLFSTIDGSVIKNVEYDRIKKDRKTKMLLCMKWNNIVDKVNYDISSKRKD